MLYPKHYRDPWIAEGVNDYIGFCSREFFCLDNASAFRVEFNGVRFATAEAAYQAQAFVTTEPGIAYRIFEAPSVYEARTIAQVHHDLRRADWDAVKVQVMESVLRAKLTQHPYVKQKLLETGDCPIVADAPTDDFWGCGADRKGRNELGRLWMKLRAELRQPERPEK